MSEDQGKAYHIIQNGWYKTTRILLHQALTQEVVGTPRKIQNLKIDS